MKTKTRFNKLTAWVLTLAMIMTFIPNFTLGVSAEDTSEATENVDWIKSSTAKKTDKTPKHILEKRRI